jgi:hypothetical protein
MRVLPVDHRGLMRLEVFLKRGDEPLYALQQVKLRPKRHQWMLTKCGAVFCHRRRGETIVIKEYRSTRSGHKSGTSDN